MTLMVNISVMRKARPWVPFTGLNTVWRLLDKKSKTILDVGCGKGEPMRFINRHKQFYTIGVDIFRPYLDTCKAQDTHNDYVLCDIKNLPFKDKSFDIVLCMEVLEHLEREEGLKIIAAMENIARRQVVLTTPIHSYKQTPYDNNVYQEHKYIWSSNELKQLGYKAVTMGIRSVADEAGLPHQLANRFFFARPLKDVFWVLVGPLTHFLPGLAGQMVCVKSIRLDD